MDQRFQHKELNSLLSGTQKCTLTTHHLALLRIEPGWKGPGQNDPHCAKLGCQPCARSLFRSDECIAACSPSMPCDSIAMTSRRQSDPSCHAFPVRLGADPDLSLFSPLSLPLAPSFSCLYLWSYMHGHATIAVPFLQRLQQLVMRLMPFVCSRGSYTKKRGIDRGVW